MQLIQEGKARIKVYLTEKVSKKMPVFYNPVMKLNRDIAVLLLNSIDRKNLQIADPLAGSGVRTIRFLLELKKDKIKNISINDYSKEAVMLIKENLKLNKIKTKKIKISNLDANIFLSTSKGFDYIDIDPFGSPNKFLDCAIKRLARNGIIAVTATDTAALAGTYPKACLRKYWALPLRNELMHEIGLRILIRKVQLIAAQYDKALTPVFCHSSNHYLRTYMKCEKSKEKVNKVLKKHNLFNNSLIWTGQLWNTELLNKMYKNLDKNNRKLFDLIKTINEESKIKTIGFYDIHKICKRNKLKIPKKEVLIEKIKNKKYKAAQTHFRKTGIRSDIELKGLIKLIP